MTKKILTHGRVNLALHTLKKSSNQNSQPLLMLHGLGESSRFIPEYIYEDWKGTVYALDFTGHGESDIPKGGGYSSEVLMGDVDIALADIGPATVCGRGLGAYIALLIAGARPELVKGAILLDGPGLAGATPSCSPYIPHIKEMSETTPDPFAIAELSVDIRPPEYATHFALLSTHKSELFNPIAICAREQPSWLQAVKSINALIFSDPKKACMHFS